MSVKRADALKALRSGSVSAQEAAAALIKGHNKILQMVPDTEEDSILLPFFFISCLFLRQYGHIPHMDA